MSDRNHIYLSLGSNIQPDVNLLKAIELLRNLGEISATSSAWESVAIGAQGPNFLNACVLFLTADQPLQIKKNVILPLEIALNRVRSKDKNAPRTIDIDILMVDDSPVNLDRWKYPYVMVPMSELLPDFLHPWSHESLAIAAQLIQKQVWIKRHPQILSKSP